ncbi:MAG TPA: hypothetical protein VJ201_06855 [Candidatus Babeliales bacterium]|nr:hypothetical protein [Candidatus Babeliales bacterium]
MKINVTFRQVMIFTCLVAMNFSGVLYALEPNKLVLLNCRLSPTGEKFNLEGKHFWWKIKNIEVTLNPGEKKTYDSKNIFGDETRRISSITWYAPDKHKKTKNIKDNQNITYMKLEKNNELIPVKEKNLHCATKTCPNTTECGPSCVCCATKKGNLCYKKGPDGNEYKYCEVPGYEC